MSSTSNLKSPILILGGTGTVGSRIASQLQASCQPVLIASRKAPSPHTSPSPNPSSTSSQPDNNTVLFDWQDQSTWANPFVAASSRRSSSTKDDDSSGCQIRSVYMIAPPGVLDAHNLMMDFVDFARQAERGVRRFVLQSASCIEPGGPAMGKVHGYFRELGSRGEIEWAVLRPSWFQQNFSEQEIHVESIKKEGKIYSATGDGKIPWVSADDIAAVAAQTLTMEEPPNTEYLVLGPELLSYDDIAKTLTEVLGKRIVHVDLTSSDLEKRHQSFGMSEDYSRMMSALDTGIKYGMENRTNDVVMSVTGVAPRRFKDYAESAKDIWVSA